jgi:phage tail-like protein
MDANQTRLHVALSQADWNRWTPAPAASSSAADSAAKAIWNTNSHELTLRPLPFRFNAGKGDRPPKLGVPGDDASADRRGAARDRFGNWYYISEDRRGIIAFSAGCKHTDIFWHCDATPPAKPGRPGIFKAAETTAAPAPAILSGLAITVDHYLVVGTIATTAQGGLLIFDLHADGPPQRICWPSSVAFAPFDMAARQSGGIFILDRRHRQYWTLDRHLRIVAPDATAPAEVIFPDVFQPAEGTQNHGAVRRPWPSATALGVASPLDVSDPVAIDELLDGSVLILDAGTTSSQVLRFAQGKLLGQPIPLTIFDSASNLADAGGEFSPAYDFAFVQPAPDEENGPSCPCAKTSDALVENNDSPIGQMYIVARSGNQSTRFEVQIKDAQIQLTPQPDYFPMRLFTGMGLVAAQGSVFYDSNRRFVPLTLMDRSRFEEFAEIVSPIFDGREPACVWHRFLFDGCLPPETSVEVWSRAADEKDNLPMTPWTREPTPRRRADGSELPFLPKPSSKNAGTFEFLFQRARGQFLQVKLSLFGDGRSTPRIGALRIYYPRFSYLAHYLPAIYREDLSSASFLDRFLSNVEGTNTSIEDRIAAVQALFDVYSAPAESLAWLASWFGLALDPAWDEQRQRLLLRHAVEFFQWRGTPHGLQMALRLAFDECVDDSMFDPPQRNGSCACAGNKANARPVDRFRIVENFLLRPPPTVEFNDPAANADVLQARSNKRWSPALGANELRQRFQDQTKRPDWHFELDDATTPEERSARESFAQHELGFVPSDLTEELAGWREFLKKRHGASSAASIPTDQPSDPTTLADWRDYLADPDPQPYAIKRRLWQDYLARRYSIVRELNAKHGTKWQDFKWISYPTMLPANPWLLTDWFQFESLVLPMHTAAHRFSVLLPFDGHTLAAQEDRLQALELGRRIIDLEKPAHTTFELKFYWALFRVGEARLGIDTSLGFGGRDPALLPPATLGQTYLAESHLTAGHPLNVSERQIVGRDHL